MSQPPYYIIRELKQSMDKLDIEQCHIVNNILPVQQTRPISAHCLKTVCPSWKLLQTATFAKFPENSTNFATHFRDLFEP